MPGPTYEATGILISKNVIRRCQEAGTKVGAGEEKIRRSERKIDTYGCPYNKTARVTLTSMDDHEGDGL